MSLQPAFLQLVRQRSKTIEVRVADDKRQAVAVGDRIRFHCDDGAIEVGPVTVVVVSWHRYSSFEALLDSQPLQAINPELTHDQQLAVLRSIYPPDREALGVIAFGIRVCGEVNRGL